MEMTRSLLKAMEVPQVMWGEALMYSTYIINRVPTRAVKDKTPYEAFYGRIPSVEHLRIFGCVAYAKNTSPHLKKLDDRSKKLVHFRCEPGTKAYRLYDPERNRIIISRDVIFNEEEAWDWTKYVQESEIDNKEFEISESVQVFSAGETETETETASPGNLSSSLN